MTQINGSPLFGCLGLVLVVLAESYTSYIINILNSFSGLKHKVLRAENIIQRFFKLFLVTVSDMVHVTSDGWLAVKKRNVFQFVSWASCWN